MVSDCPTAASTDIDEEIPACTITRFLPDRHVMVLLCALCTFINYADRVNISVAIIYMSDNFAYSLTQQSAILAAFFLGYIPMQLGGALLCRRFGGKTVLLRGALFWSLFTILTPVTAKLGLWPLLICRVSMGFAEGVAFPAVFHFLSAWVPAKERARAVACFITGANVGTTIALIVAPLIVDALGWRFIFYIFGSAGFVWIALWHFLAYDAPVPIAALSVVNGDGQCVSQARLQLTIPPRVHNVQSESVESSAGIEGDDGVIVALSSRSGSVDDHRYDRLPPASPSVSSERVGQTEDDAETTTDVGHGTYLGLSSEEWQVARFILTNRQTLTLCLSQFMNGLPLYSILTWLPTYLRNVYNVDTKQLSYSFAPYLTMALATGVGGWAADRMVLKGYSLTTTRKMLTIIAATGSAGLLVLFTRMGTVGVGIAVLSLSMGFMSLHSGGFESGYLDLAGPETTGLFKATSNTLGALSGFVAVPFSTVVLHLTGGSWRLMFASLSLWLVLQSIVFCAYYSAERVLP